ncbi:MAG: CapA family protein, partial [Deltaproteobacteria bacterium]|nr:CapA family protein [Deltaproteobacteria bacterium]
GDAQAEVIICSDWAPIRGFKDIILQEPEAVYGDLLPELRGGDMRIVNLECPLVDNGKPVSKSGAVLKGVSGHISGLTRVPFEVATLGNNHVFDYGTEAFIKTRNLLHENSIKTVGAGMSIEEASAPLIIPCKGSKIGIINFSEGEDLTAAGENPGVFGWEVDEVVHQVQGLKNKVNATIVICHGGVEYIPYPPPYLAAAFQRIADAGADLIIGHHPHVPQGVQIWNQVPICYSLGNFVFFQHTQLQFRKIGYFVKAGIVEKGISYIRIVPYEILPTRLQLLKNKKYQWVMKKLKGISEPLDEFPHIVEAWNGFIKHYGIMGFHNEIANIMDQLAKEPGKGAAMFRNRLTTMQHNQHLVDTMTRIMDGTIDHAPTWAVDTVAEWLTHNISDTREGS